MYNKMIECLKEYCYYFYEYDKVFFEEKGFHIYNVIGIENDLGVAYYLEFDSDGEIVIWNIYGKVVNVIYKKTHYKMLFELGRVLEKLM